MAMVSTLLKLCGLAFLVVVMTAAVVVHRRNAPDPRLTAEIAGLRAERTDLQARQAELQAQKRALEDQKRTLETIVDRLSAQRRAAQVLVTHQSTDTSGVQRTDLLFMEVDAQDRPLAPRRFTIEGDVVHIGGLVIRFDQSYVRAGDALRGKSLALFTRLHGDHQAPADAHRLDVPGDVPEAYRSDPVASTPNAFERSLWADFWRLAEDEAFAAEHGVTTAHGQSVWGMFRPGRLYTVTLDADGGLGLTSEPVRPILAEALKRIADPTPTVAEAK